MAVEPEAKSATDSSPQLRAGALYRLGSIAPKPRCAAISRISPPGLKGNAETIVEIRALRNEITHMIDAAIATERDKTLSLN
jgi:hypothetical protein